MAEIGQAPAEFDLQTYLADLRTYVDVALDAALPAADALPGDLHRAMRHSVFAGGKRVRPALAIAGCEAVGGEAQTALPAAVAVELVHTYSLIHDDLPAFDDELLRRGQPTCHAVFGDAVAILAGDALQALAFEVVAEAGRVNGQSRGWLDLAAELGKAAGSQGMCGGQTLDIAAAGADLTLDELRQLHAYKTGALLTAAVVGGGLVGGAHAGQVAALRAYGDALGLAFQVVDDLLDVEGSAEELGKNPGGDAERDQPTFPALIGVEASRGEAQRLHDEAIAALATLDTQATAPLRALAEYVVARDR